MNNGVRILAALLLNRVFVVGLGLLFHKVTRDYDLSASDTAFIKWDAVYFIGIAKNGYCFEDQFAFYPGFPVLIRVICLVTGMSAELVGVLLPSLFYVLAGFVLYKLTLSVGYDQAFAWRTVRFWAIAPTSIFFCAPYTESVFALLSFLGMLFWIRSKWLLACVTFTACGFVRSNGVVLAGFFAFSALKQFVQFQSSSQHILKSFVEGLLKWRFSSSRLVRATLLVFCAIPCLLPPLIFAVYANKVMCPGCEWCGSSPYKYIQQKYWGLGFMKFWRINQLPNIALAAPIVYYVAFYVVNAPRNPRLLPFVFHLLFLLMFALLFAHVNVTTRLLLAASPAAWWALASHPGQSAIVFSITYMVVGTALFVNFLPWT